MSITLMDRRSQTQLNRQSGRAALRTATNAKEEQVKRFYQFLANCEKRDHDALQRIYPSVREDFFAAGNFAPF